MVVQRCSVRTSFMVCLTLSLSWGYLNSIFSTHTFLDQHPNSEWSEWVVVVCKMNFIVIGANGVSAHSVSTNEWPKPFSFCQAFRSLVPSTFCMQNWHNAMNGMSHRN